MVKMEHHTDSEFKTRVAVYARFSCDKQRDASIDDQVFEARKYCERHGYEIVNVYADYAISGRSDDRPQFLSMIEDAKTGAFDTVLVWAMDRFARNMQDQFYYEKIINDAGVRLESIKENISGNGIEASMSKGMHAIFAQIRSQTSAEDTMRGMIGKARKCQYLGYRWLGYTHDGDTITLDPASAPIARELHERYLAGDPVKDIVAWLNGCGVRGRNGRPIGYQFVTGILKNWAYAGVYTWGKRKDELGRIMLDADGEPVPLVRIEDGIPAIVTTDEKRECLRRLQFRKHANSKADFMLSGKMFCPACGKPMHGEMCRNKNGVDLFRYCCQGRRKACNGVYWKESVEAAIASSIRSMLTDLETVELLADAFIAWRSRNKPKASVEAARADLKAVIKQRDNLIKAVEDGMPYKHVKEKLEKLDAQQAGIERKIEDLSRTETQITKKDVIGALGAISAGEQSDEEIIKGFVDQVWVYKEQAVAVMNFNGKTSTPHEITCAYENTRNRRLNTVSSDLILVSPRIRKTKPNEPINAEDASMQVMMLENGLGVVVSLKVA